MSGTTALVITVIAIIVFFLFLIFNLVRGSERRYEIQRREYDQKEVNDNLVNALLQLIPESSEVIYLGEHYVMVGHDWDNSEWQSKCILLDKKRERMEVYQDSWHLLQKIETTKLSKDDFWVLMDEIMKSEI